MTDNDPDRNSEGSDASGSVNGKVPRPSLSGRQTWVFDLDNTLYPPEAAVFAQIDQRMGGFIAEMLGIPFDEAHVIQKGLFVKYGTTLLGLMTEYDIEPKTFLAYVHDIDVSVINPDSGLVRGLERLAGRRLIFTNGDVGHAERVMDRLGIDHLFDGIFDVIAADYVPKPHLPAYHAFVDHFDVDPDDSVFVEDMARNLVPAAEMGMATVWLRNGHQWSGVDLSEAHIHYQIDDLPAWLATLSEDTEREG